MSLGRGEGREGGRGRETEEKLFHMKDRHMTTPEVHMTTQEVHMTTPEVHMTTPEVT